MRKVRSRPVRHSTLKTNILYCFKYYLTNGINLKNLFLKLSAGHLTSTACRQTVSGTISLPSQGYFSPFPHGTGSLSVAGVYLALGDGPPGFPQGSTCPTVLGYPIQQVQCISLTGLSPSMVGLSRLFSYTLSF